MTSALVNSVVFVNPEDGGHIDYQGPFRVDRTGGDFEALLPVDDAAPGTIAPTAADTLAEREGHIVVTLADCEVFATGVIVAADRIVGFDDVGPDSTSEALVVRVRDGNYAHDYVEDNGE